MKRISNDKLIIRFLDVDITYKCIQCKHPKSYRKVKKVSYNESKVDDGYEKEHTRHTCRRCDTHLYDKVIYGDKEFRKVYTKEYSYSLAFNDRRKENKSTYEIGGIFLYSFFNVLKDCETVIVVTDRFIFDSIMLCFKKFEGGQFAVISYKNKMFFVMRLLYQLFIMRPKDNYYARKQIEKYKGELTYHFKILETSRVEEIEGVAFVREKELLI